MTFRKQAIATLKSLREQGITLNIKLNASNQALHDELVRIDNLLMSQEDDLKEALVESYAVPTEPTVPATDTRIKTAAKFTAQAIHTYKTQVHPLVKELLLKTLLAVLYVTLYAIKATKYLAGVLQELRYDIKFYRQYPQSIRQASKLGKCLLYTYTYTKAAYDYIKLRRTVNGGYESKALETVFCLG